MRNPTSLTNPAIKRTSPATVPASNNEMRINKLPLLSRAASRVPLLFARHLRHHTFLPAALHLRPTLSLPPRYFLTNAAVATRTIMNEAPSSEDGRDLIFVRSLNLYLPRSTNTTAACWRQLTVDPEKPPPASTLGSAQSRSP